MRSIWSATSTGWQRTISRNTTRYLNSKLVLTSLMSFYRQRHGPSKQVAWTLTLNSSSEVMTIQSRGTGMIVRWRSPSVSNVRCEGNVSRWLWPVATTTASGAEQMSTNVQYLFGSPDITE